MRIIVQTDKGKKILDATFLSLPKKNDMDAIWQAIEHAYMADNER